MTSGVCFVWLTALFNRFGLTIRIGVIPVLGKAITVPYLHSLAITPRANLADGWGKIKYECCKDSERGARPGHAGQQAVFFWMNICMC
jgi:hypothetical protein